MSGRKEEGWPGGGGGEGASEKNRLVVGLKAISGTYHDFHGVDQPHCNQVYNELELRAWRAFVVHHNC